MKTKSLFFNEILVGIAIPTEPSFEASMRSHGVRQAVVGGKTIPTKKCNEINWLILVSEFVGIVFSDGFRRPAFLSELSDFPLGESDESDAPDFPTASEAA